MTDAEARDARQFWIRAAATVAVTLIVCTTIVIVVFAGRFSNIDAVLGEIRSGNNVTESNHQATICLLSLARDQRVPLDQRRPLTREFIQDRCHLTDQEIDEVLR